MMAWLTMVNDWVVAGADAALGWTTCFSMDVQLLIVALGTSVILTVVRLFTTNQNLLKRCRDDKRTLKALIRQAKRDGDRDAVRRHRATIGMIGIQSMKAEGKPLLVSLLPIVFLACWAATRLAFVPVAPGEAVEVRAYLAPMAIDTIVHLMPEDGLEVEGSWIRRVAPDIDTHGNVTNGLASWTVTAARRDQPYQLQFRHGGRAVTQTLIVDGRSVAPPLVSHADPDLVMTEVMLAEYKFLGWVPGIPAIVVPPWLAAYMLIAVPFVVVLKRVTGIC